MKTKCLNENAVIIVNRLTEAIDETNLCVILRGGDDGLEVLLVADEQGRWSIPGGHVKGDESHAQAVQREVKEETGLDIEEPTPLFWARHVARGPGRITNLFYTIVSGDKGDSAVRPGGGDVTEVRWVNVNSMTDLNGTDRLAVLTAANRVHNPQALVDDEVELAESLGFAVATVSAPPAPVQGIYLRINGPAADGFALRLKSWAESLSWPVTLIATNLFESTESALQRASANRRLTPMLECLLRVSDALWRYDNLVGPALAKGHIVLETGPEINQQHLLDRGVPKDLLHCAMAGIPRATLVFHVGEDVSLTELQPLQDVIEDLKDEHGLRR